jgi:hypothetical protein
LEQRGEAASEKIGVDQGHELPRRKTQRGAEDQRNRYRARVHDKDVLPAVKEKGTPGKQLINRIGSA